MSSLWNGKDNAERYYQYYINLNLDKDFYPNGNNKCKYVIKNNKSIKTKEILKENQPFSIVSNAQNKAELYKNTGNYSWLVKCKEKNSNNYFWLPMSSIKKTEELKGTDLKLNKGNVTEGVFFACVVVLFTSQREYFNKDKVTDIKDIEANQVKDYIKKNISPKCKEIFSKDTINSIQFIYNFNEIVTNHNKNFSDTVFGTLALNLVDAQHFIDIDNNNVKHIFDEIIKDCLKTVNKSQLKKFSRDVYINDFNDKILIEAKGPIDASTGVKEDITITINNKPYKISLKNGNNVLGQFGISSKSGNAIFEKIQSFFTTYFNFNFPNGLKMKFDKLVVNSNSLSEMSHEVMKEAKNILVKSKVEKQKDDFKCFFYSNGK